MSHYNHLLMSQLTVGSKKIAMGQFQSTTHGALQGLIIILMVQQNYF